MPDRDAVFIPVFDELFDNHNSALYRFIEWGLIYASKQAVTDDVAEKCATILSWLLISPNNELRDKATKAIICILNSHMVALLSLLQAFEGIDDPYISERIYGIAFGCVVNEDSPQQVRALAEHVYSIQCVILQMMERYFAFTGAMIAKKSICGHIGRAKEIWMRKSCWLDRTGVVLGMAVLSPRWMKCVKQMRVVPTIT